MVVGEPPDGFGSIEQLHATLHQGLLDLLYLLEEPVGHGFVAERPQPLRRLQLGRTGGGGTPSVSRLAPPPRPPCATRLCPPPVGCAASCPLPPPRRTPSMPKRTPRCLRWAGSSRRASRSGDGRSRRGRST